VRDLCAAISGSQQGLARASETCIIMHAPWRNSVILFERSGEAYAHWKPRVDSHIATLILNVDDGAMAPSFNRERI